MEHIYGTRQELVQFIGEQTRQIERLRAAVRAFTVHATYPVSTKINSRGYAWRGEDALDYAKSLGDAALEQRGDK
jgi:hypothetical protein